MACKVFKYFDYPGKRFCWYTVAIVSADNRIVGMCAVVVDHFPQSSTKESKAAKEYQKHHSTVNCQLSTVNGQRSTANGQRPSLNGQRITLQHQAIRCLATPMEGYANGLQLLNMQIALPPATWMMKRKARPAARIHLK